jgi:nucleoside-diphosphate-sugar epimerase
MTTVQTITSEGIFYGLPTFPDHDGKKYSAIVTGANGITGAHMVQHLAKFPERWESIYALSRKVPTSTQSHVKTISLDFLNSTPDQIAKVLKDNSVKAYVLEASLTEVVL